MRRLVRILLAVLLGVVVTAATASAASGQGRELWCPSRGRG
jgi:hypothetical protein